MECNLCYQPVYEPVSTFLCKLNSMFAYDTSVTNYNTFQLRDYLRKLLQVIFLDDIKYKR